MMNVELLWIRQIELITDGIEFSGKELIICTVNQYSSVSIKVLFPSLIIIYLKP